MSERREREQESALARTETLLHQAADFVPTEGAPEGLATRALARWEMAGRDCSPRQQRNYVPAVSLACLGVALLGLWARAGNGALPALPEQTMGDIPPFQSLLTQRAPASLAQHMASLLPMELRSRKPSSRLAHRAHYHASHRKAHAHNTPPKAIWTVETVQTQQVGILYAVLTMEEAEAAQSEAEGRPAILKPGILKIPLQSEVTTCESPSGSPFPMPPSVAISAPYAPLTAEPEDTDTKTDPVHSHEESTKP